MRYPLRSLATGARFSLLLATGCTTVRTVQPAELSPPHPPRRTWVTRVDRSVMALDSARVSADTVIGIVNGARQRLPLSEVTVLRVREASPDRTAALVFFSAPAAVVIMANLLNPRPEELACPFLSGSFPVPPQFAGCPINGP